MASSHQTDSDKLEDTIKFVDKVIVRLYKDSKDMNKLTQELLLHNNDWLVQNIKYNKVVKKTSEDLFRSFQYGLPKIDYNFIGLLRGNNVSSNIINFLECVKNMNDAALSMFDKNLAEGPEDELKGFVNALKNIGYPDLANNIVDPSNSSDTEENNMNPESSD